MRGDVLVRISLAPWLSVALRVLIELSEIGYRIPDRDVDQLIESAVSLEML
jgi:hypothetical protein